MGILEMTQLSNYLDFRKYKRFFAFGCSFTRYRWPTWADIISVEIPESYNCGRSGAGNQYIFHSLIEANQRYKFNSDDLVLIMWSSISREDRYVKDKWLSLGSIYNQNTYDDKFVKTLTCPRGYLIKDLSIITAIKIILDGIGCDYDFLSMVPITKSSDWSNTIIDERDVLDFYSSTVNCIKPSVFETIYKSDWHNKDIESATVKFSWHKEKWKDSHPTPKYHMDYLRIIYPDIVFSEQAIHMVKTNTTELLSKVVTEDNYIYNHKCLPTTL